MVCPGEKGVSQSVSQSVSVAMLALLFLGKAVVVFAVVLLVNRSD